MSTIFRHTVAGLRGQMYGWGLTFAVLGWISVWSYNAVVAQQAQWQQLLDSLPPAMMVFFGEMSKAFSRTGFLDVMLFSYGVVILSFFGIIAGAGLVVRDEEAGRLDLIQAHPVSRTALFAGRFLAMTVVVAAVLAFTWAGCVVGLIGSKFEVGVLAMALPCIVSFPIIMLFAGLALWLSMVLPSYVLAVSTASIILVAAYAVTSLARIITGLRGVARLSPLNYYQSSFSIDGVNLRWFAALLIMAAIFIIAAWRSYQRRDLRVSGEGNWRLPTVNRSGWQPAVSSK